MTLTMTHPPELVQPFKWQIVPVPIRENVAVSIQAPRDLTPAEAQKVARVVLAFGDLTPTGTGE